MVRKSMIQCGTWDTGEEIQITYPEEQRVLYEKKDKIGLSGKRLPLEIQIYSFIMKVPEIGFLLK
ncbi:MAG: hypothetical protein WCO26_20870 [Deltaproteobacteria bacterium]